MYSGAEGAVAHGPHGPHGPHFARFAHVPAIHLARQSPFYGPPGHIDSRDGVNLCPSSDPNPSRQPSRAHPLARWFAGRSPTGNRPATHSRQSPVSDWLVPGPTLSCNSPCTPIAFLSASRAHPLARWHQFVSIERREPLQTALQGTSARAMVCRKIIDLPHTAVRARLGPIKARPHTFVKFTWHGNRLSTRLQGTLTRAMASICVHRATRTPPDSTPEHILSRDGLQEDHRPATHTALRARLVTG